jgi:PfaB family protein
VRNLGGEEWLVILEGVERAKVGAVAVPERPLGPHRLGLFAIEADDPAGLARRGRELAGFVDRNAGLDIDALARRWWLDGRGRARARLGMAIVADSPLSLKRLLERGAIPETPRERMLARATTGDSTIHLATAGLGQCSRERVAFVYPGLGNYFAGMGRELAALWPEVTRRLDTESRRSRDQLDPGIWWSGRERFDFADHRAPILGQAWVGSFVTDLMRSMGVEPGAAIGYSMGETAALVALRAWTDRDAMFERLRSSRLFISELAGRCNAARRAWGLGPDEAVDWVAGLVPRSVDAVRAAALDEPRVMVLIRNSRDETVIGGHRARVAAVVERLRCAFVEVPTVSTVHCSVATSVAEEYRAFHELETEAPGAVRFYSGVWGRAYEVSRRSASEAIGAQATEMIDYPRVIDQAYADGVRVFLEMGPGGSCTRLIGRILEGRPHLAISACRADVDPLAGVLRVMAEMVANRLPVDLGPLYDFERGEVGQADLTSSAKAAKRLVRIEVGRAKFEVPPVPSKGSAEIVDRGVTRRVAIAIASEPVAACNGQMERGRLDENGPTFETAFESRIEVIMNRSSADQTSADQTSAGELVAELEPVPNGRPEPAGIDAPGLDLLRQLTKAEEAKAEAHRAFLKTSEGYGAVIGRYLEHELSLLSGGQIQAAGLDEQDRPVAVRVPAPVARVTRPVGPSVLDRDKCLEFAVGKMGNVLGAEFAAVDAFPTRVRLPDEPLMLVDRIVEIEGEARSLGSGRVVTEHDILPGAWYLDAERIAPCVAIEAGQADLFLSGYLGIDFETKGLAVYRLLDATVVYHRGLPGPGEMIRYDIRINQFFRQGTTILFRFEFDATVDGEPLLTMRDGCAGFFTAEELAAGRGIVAPAIERRTRPDGGEPKGFALVPFARGAMTELEVDAVRAGELGAGFGAPFDRLPAGEHVLLPGGLMRLIERVAEFSGDGGRFGKGMIRAESAIHADDWFMVCHFVDDRVMPGTLMYECCLQTLRLWMMRAGVVGQRGEVAFEPVVGIKNQLKCRGQIIESTKLVTYEVTIKECGYRPEPYAVADAIIYGDGKALVEVSDMAIQLTGMDRAGLERLWSSAGGVTQASSKPALYDTARITAFAIGKPSDAFGERYRVFDSERFIARLPGPPYQFLDRITAVGGEPWVVAAGAWAEAEFDVEPDHWYFEADRQDRMPFAVLLEAALQPCGWLAAYMGSALTSPDDLKFRNLGGKAVQHRAVTRDSGTLTTRITVTKVASTAGMIIQHFDLSMSDRVGLVYEGETNFGFFQTKAHENQVGVRDASPYILTDAERARSLSFPVPLEPPFADERWRMITQVDHFLDQGGPHGLGLVRGSVTVDPSMWFFKAHFMGDPVWPGSLGLESMLQLMKVAAARRWGVRADTAWECPILGREHQWIYRGQIVPRNHRVTVQAEITSRDDQNRVIVADGHLEVDGKVIYQMKSFSLKIVGRST